MLLPVLALTIAQRSDIPLVAGVGITGVAQGGRAPVGIDTVQQSVVEGRWKAPDAGVGVPGARGAARTWAEVKANKDGVFEGGPAGAGYIDLSASSEIARPMLLEASGATMVYVNGEPRGGDPYSYGYLKLPIMMRSGQNEFLFSCGRGRLQAKLVAPQAAQMLNVGDITLPDILVDERGDLFAAVPVINCEDAEVSGLSIGARVGDGPEVRMNLPRIEALTLRKCPFKISAGGQALGDVPLHLKLYRKGVAIHEADTTVSVRKPTEHYKRTFISGIDGSVQYFGVCPSLKPSKANALILTVHGASVEGIGQARAYTPKDWCTIVAATNRRPYGFDWEDWGRMDAMEVWDVAKKTFPHDSQRAILTGHSMGGHGTWSIGLTYPDEFAAIGPSAGWISFWSYAGGWEPRDPNPVEQILRRSMNSSDTLLMLKNSLLEETFILHGDKDDNVPVEQARTMKQKLTDVGAKFAYHEEPGAGHWWGNQCVDWPPMFDMFSNARLAPKKTLPFAFTTVNPGVSSTYRGYTIEEQIDPLKPSTISVATDGRVKTENVALYGMPAGSGRRYVRATGDSSDALVQTEKSHEQTGPFKLAFRNRMVFVVGTHGTPEENAWASNKARFDAENWYYRGNGSVDIIRDTEVGRYGHRNLVLFGNSDTNSAFKLIANCPIHMDRSGVQVNGRRYPGAAAVYLYPRGSELIAVVGGSSLAAMRYTDRLPYFTSGVAYPDWTVLSPDTLVQGSKVIPAVGFFGNRWEFDGSQSAFLTATGNTDR